jgi:CheY-like chemotaxis protein
LQQVVWNLFTNAVKFTPEGGRVRVRLERVEDYAEVTVTDNGQGINPQFLPFIFDRFRQADGSTTRKHGGLGLGLAIARHLVEMHGGTIKAESDGMNHGATFSVRLPLRTANRLTDVEVETSPALGKSSQSTLSGLPALEGLRILIVDDELDTRDLIATVLLRCGAEVKGCETAAEAFEQFQEWPPDLLISDIGLPGEDGFSLIKKVRETDAEGEQVPAIALTAYASPDDRARVLDAGFQMHIAKPVDPEQLVAMAADLAARRNKV